MAIFQTENYVLGLGVQLVKFLLCAPSSTYTGPHKTQHGGTREVEPGGLQSSTILSCETAWAPWDPVSKLTDQNLRLGKVNSHAQHGQIEDLVH